MNIKSIRFHVARGQKIKLHVVSFINVESRIADFGLVRKPTSEER